MSRQFLQNVFVLTALVSAGPQLTLAADSSGPEAWFLPAVLDDSNTEVTFEVDSTWHTIHGTTSGIKGKLWLEDPTRPDSIRGSVEIPVKTFDTDNSSRDGRLREVMNESAFNSIQFDLISVDGLCAPVSDSMAAGCSAAAAGKLSIAGHEEAVNPSLSVRKGGNGYIVAGTATFSWKLFPIEDPSILVARLDQNVSIKFTVKLGPPSGSPTAERNFSK